METHVRHIPSKAQEAIVDGGKAEGGCGDPCIEGVDVDLLAGGGAGAAQGS